MTRVYQQALVLVVLPLCAGLAVLLWQIDRLVDEERERQVQILAEANRQAQVALAERVERTHQIATLLAGSSEVIQAFAKRDNMVLQRWGSRVISAGLASEVYFLSRDGQVIARGHWDFRSGDRYADSLFGATSADRAAYAGIARLRGARPTFAARRAVLRFGVQWVGTILLYREITQEVLADLGVPPGVDVDVRPGWAAGPRTLADGVITESFDLPSSSEQGLHLRLTKDASADLARLRALNLTLLVLAAIALLVLPALTIYALYRLLSPVRLLQQRLQRFATEGADRGDLVPDIQALAHTRNELGAIAAAVAAALQALQAAQADLVQSQKLAGLGAMVSGVTHELNTPLGNSIIAATTLRERAAELARELAAGSVRRSLLEQFLADCDEATRILESSLARAGELLRGFKQVAVDQASDRRRPYDLHAVAADVLLTLRPTLKKLPIEVVLEVPVGIGMEGYPGALAQVLTNLVQNAAVHGLEGAAKGTIRIGAEPRRDEVVLRVADDGRGIAAENLPKVFEPFFTTRLGRGGSGLGLHISRRLVTGALGGTIELRSQPGAGTEFLLTLPRTAPGAAGPGSAEGVPQDDGLVALGAGGNQVDRHAR